MNDKTCKDYWNRRWSRFSRFFIIRRWDGIWGKNGSFIRIMTKHISDMDKKKLIELGGAMSYSSLALIKWLNADVTLLDYSEEGIQRTRRLYTLNGCAPYFMQGDMFSLQDRKYDVVMHWGVIEHFNDPVRVLSACSNFVKPGGLVIFTMPNMECCGAYLWKHLNRTDWNRHKHHSDNDIESAAENSGYILVKKFFWGAPLIQISPCTPYQVVRFFLQLLQYFLYLLGMVIPIYHKGSRTFSMHRGFVLRKI